MSIVDLHVHSTKSDGTFTPTELVNYAMEKGLRAFALTDHDTVDGLEEAIAYAEKLRRDFEENTVPPEITALQANRRKLFTAASVPEVIPGIEFSTEYQGKDIHIVGLYIDYQNPAFQEYLQNFIDSRTARNQKMCTLLQEAGIDISYEQLQKEFPGSVITRAHYAKYLMDHGYTKSLKEAFERYVGDHCPYFVPREKVTPTQAVELILAADGIPILAHPVLYRMSDARLEALVAELKEAGLMGIEAVYSTYNAGEERQMRILAQKYHLLISGGSDFHGDNKPKLDLGCGYGSLMVQGSVLSEIKRSRKNLLFTDMDGTLLRDDSTVSSHIKKELDRITEAGHRLILTSGRPLPAILEVCEEAGLTYPGTIIISNNGGYIYDYDEDKAILEYRLSQEDMTYIISKADEFGIHIHGYTKSHIVCREMNAEIRYYTRRIHMPLKYVSDIADALPQGSYKLQAISLTDHDALVRFRDSLLNYCGDRIQMIFSNEHYLEILPAEAGKGNAIRFVTDYLPISRSHTFAAGDAENDISMLQAAHIGIAMQNATDAVKENADIVTALDNNNDGLLEVLAKYFQ
uniref:Cof-type HAD-IIB family hydrolase n=1 Tax=Acetatifactor sp. TaxID=1872090 RepID=UPI004057665E